MLFMMVAIAYLLISVSNYTCTTFLSSRVYLLSATADEPGELPLATDDPPIIYH